MAYRKREETARIIWDDLKKNGKSDGWTIRKRTGLSPMQFQYGKGFLQDHLQTKHGQPLIWSPHYGVYDLTTSEAEWLDYLMSWRLRSIHTQLRRTEETALAGGQLFGTRKKSIKVAIAGITAARQMVEALV
jgi:hypothetical protein